MLVEGMVGLLILIVFWHLKGMVWHLVLQMTRYDEVHKLAEARQGVAGGQDCAREIEENEGSEISSGISLPSCSPCF